MADKKRVLLADDEADLITIMSTMLTTHGFYEIVTAKDGLEAYRKARNQKFDLICSDFKMPKLNGVELIGALREALYNKDTPILIVSGYTAEIKAEIDASGLKKITLIEKPVSEEKFLKSVELAFKNETDVVQVKAKPKLDVGFINPFIESTVKTIQTMGSLQNITADKPRVLKKG